VEKAQENQMTNIDFGERKGESPPFRNKSVYSLKRKKSINQSGICRTATSTVKTRMSVPYPGEQGLE
ncbi:hypothetical protein HispidOSU_001487, partial [Sigmodon hispidus]